jgi:hypothetical protein
MGSLELPLPELGNDSLSWSAKDIEKRIRAQTPSDLRDSINVRPFRNGKQTGIRIEYDDKAERFVFVAIEYPQGSGKHEDVVPHRGTY